MMEILIQVIVALALGLQLLGIFTQQWYVSGKVSDMAGIKSGVLFAGKTFNKPQKPRDWVVLITSIGYPATILFAVIAYLINRDSPVYMMLLIAAVLMPIVGLSVDWTKPNPSKKRGWSYYVSLVSAVLLIVALVLIQTSGGGVSSMLSFSS